MNTIGTTALVAELAYKYTYFTESSLYDAAIKFSDGAIIMSQEEADRFRERIDALASIVMGLQKLSR